MYVHRFVLKCANPKEIWLDIFYLSFPGSDFYSIRGKAVKNQGFKFKFLLLELSVYNIS